MANDYASTADLESVTNMDATKYGVLMQLALDTAAEHINNLTNRSYGGYVADASASTRLFVGNGTGVLRIDEATDIISIAAKTSYTDTTYTNWLTTDWIPFRGDDRFPVFGTPAITTKPYTRIMVNDTTGDYTQFPNGYTGTSWSGFASDRYYESNNSVYQPTVQVTAKWGYATAVPNTIKFCTLILAARLAKRAQANFADVTGNAEIGDLRYVNEIDKDVKAMLYKGRFMKPAI
jgi:hypothetical protein